MSEVHRDRSNSKKRKFRPNRRRNKLAIVFDENARREFLTGFHKRKLQRKNRAKEELEKQLKAERKRIKAEAKEQYLKLLLSQKQIPEVSDLASESIDMGTHSVSVTELSAADLARKNNWIGINEVQYQTKENEEELNETYVRSKDEQYVEGMEIKKNVKKKSSGCNVEMKNCKDIKKSIKQQATSSVKNSKIFKKKAAMEKIKNIKLNKKQERKFKKLQKLSKRSKKKIIKQL